MGSKGVMESKGIRESEGVRGSKGIGIPSVRGWGVIALVYYIYVNCSKDKLYLQEQKIRGRCKP